jgi:hypothetical protein
MKFGVRRPDHNLALMRLVYLELIKVAAGVSLRERAGHIKHLQMSARTCEGSVSQTRPYFANSCRVSRHHKSFRFSLCVSVEV